MKDHRIGLDLVTDVLEMLHRHGFTRGDDQHAGRVLFLIADPARIDEGTQDHPSGPTIHQAPSPQTTLEPPGPESRDVVVIPASERNTMLIALDIAVDDMRGRAGLCTGCPDQSCPACQSRLRDARDYDRLADRMFHVADAALAAQHGQADAARPARPSSLAAGQEAGQ